ncbi:hypothetical protein KJA17_02275 [Patescibacteria group bacterium]|nr:hypothetical protein [Patescibacteria group bacterium]
MSEKIISKLKIIFIPCQENNYRPKFLESEFLVYYLVILILLRLIIIPFLVYFPKTIFFAEISRAILIELTNGEREDLGINILEENPQLNKAALLKAQDMINKDYFSHQSPKGVTPWYWFQKADYDYQLAGENLGIGFLDSEEIHQAWKNSPSHKANLLNSNFQDIGIAVLKGEFEGNETTVVVQLFGSPLTKKTLKEPQKIVNGTEPETKNSIEKEEEKATEPERETISEEVISVESQGLETESSLGSDFFRFMTMSYNDLVQKIIFFSLVFIIISLIINIFVKFDVQHKDLIWKTAIFVIVLILFIFIDKEFVIRIIPHSLSIL